MSNEPNDNEEQKVDIPTTDETTTVTDTQHEEPAITDPHCTDEIYTSLKRTNVDDSSLAESVLGASAKCSDLQEYLVKVDDIPAKDLKDGLTTNETLTIGINYESLSKTPKNDTLYSAINDGDFVNAPSHAGKRLGINKVDVNAKGRLTGSSAVAKFTSRLGIGKHTTITLWHSGFSLVVAPPKETDIINLQYAIAKAEHKLGYETNNFVYSNYGVVINKLLVDFILDHVVASSLKLPEGESYIDYIKVSDLDTLAIGQATSMRPNGYPLTITCKNSLVLEENRPLCDFTATGNVITENLLWVNRNILTPETLAHISKTSPGSHDVTSVKAYQDSLAANKEKELSLTDVNGVDIKFTLETPTLRKYFDSGELWVNSVIANAEELFSESDSAEVREGKIDDYVSATTLNKYNGYITAIVLGDSYVEDDGSISAVLDVLSGDAVIGNKLLKGILDYIDSGYVSVVAKYNFTCPECKDAGRSANQDSGSVPGFKEFIPINAVESFFDLSALMFTQIVNRQK